MIEVYRAAHPALAHLLRGLLEAGGIEAQVVGEFAFSLRGEAPATTETLPRVCVVNEDDAVRAREIAVAFDQGRTDGPMGTVWRCQNCAEMVEGQFAVCWNCGTSRHG